MYRRFALSEQDAADFFECRRLMLASGDLQALSRVAQQDLADKQLLRKYVRPQRAAQRPDSDAVDQRGAATEVRLR